MNADALPIPLLIVLALCAWSVYFAVIGSELQWNRRTDLHARHAGHDVIPQGVQHSEADDHVEGEQEQAGPDRVADDESEGCSIHARSVHLPPIYLPPGIPSVTERLDRWRDIS